MSIDPILNVSYWFLLHFLICIYTFQWVPELQHFAPGIPVVLVGTKLGNSQELVLQSVSIICFQSFLWCPFRS